MPFTQQQIVILVIMYIIFFMNKPELNDYSYYLIKFSKFIS